MAKDESDILKLLSFVRKHETYKGDILQVNITHFKSVADWLGEEQIAKGAYAVRASVLLNKYKDWCKSNNIEKKDMAKSRAFHSMLKQVLNYNNNKKSNNLFYYVNKKVEYEPSKEKDGQGAKEESSKKEE
jgi:hypothetical protein